MLNANRCHCRHEKQAILCHVLLCFLLLSFIQALVTDNAGKNSQSSCSQFHKVDFKMKEKPLFASVIVIQDSVTVSWRRKLLQQDEIFRKLYKAPHYRELQFVFGKARECLTISNSAVSKMFNSRNTESAYSCKKKQVS